MPAYDTGIIVVTCKARTKCGYDFSFYYPQHKQHRYFENVKGEFRTVLVKEQRGEEILSHPSVDYARRFEFIDPVQCEAEIGKLETKMNSYLSSADIVRDILHRFDVLFDPNSYALAASAHRRRGEKKTSCLIENQPYNLTNPEDIHQHGEELFQIHL